ncbi:MAG: hypothetical protein Q4C32_01550, partial [Eubacteriales bacterium]|nr:hypothetical protein [Eubacteriales bacterium]
VCRDFILPEPASYVFFYAVFNLRNLLYIIQLGQARKSWVQPLYQQAAPSFCRMSYIFCLHTQLGPYFDTGFIIRHYTRKPKKGVL